MEEESKNIKLQTREMVNTLKSIIILYRYSRRTRAKHSSHFLSLERIIVHLGNLAKNLPSIKVKSVRELNSPVSN